MSRRPYIRKVSKTTWWMSTPTYVGYMMREVTCIFIGAYAAVLVTALWRLSQGKEAYEAYMKIMTGNGAYFAFHVLALVFALYHTFSWFNVTPKAMPIQVGENKLPGWMIIGAHYGGWLVLSLLVLILVGN